MPKFRVLEKSFIGNALHEEGAVIEYHGPAAANLEPLDAEAEKLSSDGTGLRLEDQVRQQIAAQGGDPDAVDTAAALNAAQEAAAQVLTTQQPATVADASALL